MPRTDPRPAHEQEPSAPAPGARPATHVFVLLVTLAALAVVWFLPRTIDVTENYNRSDLTYKVDSYTEYGVFRVFVGERRNLSKGFGFNVGHPADPDTMSLTTRLICSTALTVPIILIGLLVSATLARNSRKQQAMQAYLAKQ